MSPTRRLLLFSAMLALVLTGCSQSTGPIAPNNTQHQLDFGYVLPDGATLDSAVFKVFATGATYQDVECYRVTRDWAEMTETWNSFDLYSGSSYDPAALGGFNVTMGMAYYAVDATGQVMAWMNGDQPNYGFLIKQPVEFSARTEYYSRERGESPPVLEITYTLGGDTFTDTLEPLGDVMINEVFPDQNFGAGDKLYSGWRNDGEKVSLVVFDLDVTQSELAAIGDYVWYDTNQNGIQDDAEMGVEGVTVHLTDCNGNILDTRLTAADGSYWFGSLQPGDYAIHFVLPDGHVFSPQDQGGDDTLDSDANPNTGATACTTLDAGEEDPTWDAGIYMPEQQDGCTHTIGYWKNHTGLGNGNQEDVVTALLGDGVWLGDEGGAKSLGVTDRYIAYDVLTQHVYGRPNNGITKLYAQLLGAKLSILDGASDADVAATIAVADAFLATHDWTDWSSLSNAQKHQVNDWKDMFDDYNNGDIGPGHCDDAEDNDKAYDFFSDR